MITLRKAEPGDRRAVAALWSAAFGDGDGLRRRFYGLCAPFEEVLTLWEDGRLGAMACVPALSLRCPNGRTLKAGYLYALAADPAARGRGYGSAMVRYAAEILRHEGADCAVTVPAQPSLFRFFERLDYVPAFFRRLWRPDPDALPAAPRGGLPPAGAAEYNALRRRHLAGRLYTDWGDGPIEFQRYLSQSSGGDLLRLDLPGGPGCAAVELEGDLARVKELLCAGEDLDGAASLLSAAFPGKRLLVSLPPWLDRGERMSRGAVHWLYSHPSPWVPVGADGWLGLAFD